MNERQNSIVNLLSDNKKKTVSELSSILGVSAVTIRQDLTILEDRGMLKRLHGSAVLNNVDDIAVRLGINHNTKLRIARKAAEYVNEGETVLIESGSINAMLALELVQHKRVTILTTNIFIARQFHNIPKANIILLGGLYQHESESMVGMLTKTCIDTLNFSKAFLGIDGFDTATGFTSRDMLRAEIAAYIIKKCNDVFIVTDSTKFGMKELASIGQASDIEHVITDNGIPDNYIQQLLKNNVELIVT